jgi:hypothetical protein
MPKKKKKVNASSPQEKPSSAVPDHEIFAEHSAVTAPLISNYQYFS